jgi:hypothetical protein
VKDICVTQHKLVTDREVAVAMHSAQCYRDKAAQARRLARFQSSSENIEKLERLAESYDRIAVDFEKVEESQKLRHPPGST